MIAGTTRRYYSELDRRFAAASASGGNEETLRAYFDRLVGTATKYDIMDANPFMSRRTVERVLKKLQDEGVVEKVGAARSTAYRRAV